MRGTKLLVRGVLELGAKGIVERLVVLTIERAHGSDFFTLAKCSLLSWNYIYCRACAYEGWDTIYSRTK